MPQNIQYETFTVILPRLSGLVRETQQGGVGINHCDA